MMANIDNGPITLREAAPTVAATMFCVVLTLLLFVAIFAFHRHFPSLDHSALAFRSPVFVAERIHTLPLAAGVSDENPVNH